MGDEFDEKMTSADFQALLYSRDRLSLLQKGLTAVMNAMQGVLAVQDDMTSAGMMSIKSAEHAKQLEQIDKDCWDRIRVELLDVYKSFKKRASVPGNEINGNDVKEKSAAECLLGLTERVDDVKKGLDTRLKITAKREENMIKEVKLLQEQLYDERQQSVELKWKAQEATENAGKYTVPVLQQQLKEKQEEISQLKRNGTVQLWDKEKAKLLESAKKREEKLTKDLAESEQRYEDMKEKLTEKLRESEEKLKIQKMKDSLDKKIVSRSDQEAEIEGLKRKLYSKDKEVARIEEEIINQQRLTVGCLKGIQKDFKILCTRQEQNKYKKVDAKRFKKIINAMLKGAKEGRLDITKADLPLQYIALPEDITGHPIKRTHGKPLELKQEIRHHLTPVGATEASPPSSPDGSPSSSPKTLKKSLGKSGGGKLEPIEGSEVNEKEEARDVMGEDPGMAFRKATNVRKRRESRASLTFQHLPHPDLVDMANAHLDVELALKQFPELTETQIKDHYDQFRRYDTSGDLLLDFTEVVRAIQSTVGNFYSPSQIREAMGEIDTDNNDTVDFYEYLTIALMVTNKRGRSEVFRSGIVKHGGQSVSKLCLIQ